MPVPFLFATANEGPAHEIAEPAQATRTAPEKIERNRLMPDFLTPGGEIPSAKSTSPYSLRNDVSGSVGAARHAGAMAAAQRYRAMRILSTPKTRPHLQLALPHRPFAEEQICFTPAISSTNPTAPQIRNNASRASQVSSSCSRRAVMHAIPPV